MTSTLESYYNEKIQIEALNVVEDQMTYSREVILQLAQSNRPVEYGAIKINLDDIPCYAKKLILKNKDPLGRILNDQRILFESHPSVYFYILPNANIYRKLNTSSGKALYGRRNILTYPNGKIIAEIVEILPEI